MVVYQPLSISWTYPWAILHGWIQTKRLLKRLVMAFLSRSTLSMNVMVTVRPHHQLDTVQIESI
jgi:hypothetical protein